METVFLLMWLADMLGNVGFVGGALTIGVAVGLLFGCIMLVCTEDAEGIPAGIKRTLPLLKWVALVLAIAVLTPSPKTIHLLAAAKAGSVAVSTPLGDKTLKALDAVLDKVIDESKKK